ncbi:MAG: Hpt domain-containing protein [Planctomycetes bacterium]|nr:Hpt domain-containing protein [Planctomycetota bacterium]
MKNALRRVNDNTRLMAELIAFFCEDSPVLLTRIDDAKAVGNAADVGRAAHSLAGLSATFDGHCVREVALRVEELADQDRLADATTDIELLRQEVDRLCAALRAFPLSASAT